jgi:hypothetical protein
MSAKGSEMSAEVSGMSAKSTEMSTKGSGMEFSLLLWGRSEVG